MSPVLVISLIAVLSAATVLAIAIAVFSPAIEREKSAKQRLQSVSGVSKTRGRNPAQDMASQRRKAVMETLKEIEEKQKASLKKKKKVVTLRMLIEQAGLDWEVKTFWMVSAGTGFAATSATLAAGQQPFIAVLVGFVAAVGLPRWIIGMMRTRRQKKFTAEFANTLDVIVRGVRSGLPVNECMQIIANESPKPVCDEFRLIVEGQFVGMDMEQCLDRMFERMPTPEVNFFAIVLTIQAKTGGNLSEALANLSKVLRARKQLRAKVQAMSAEAKAGALIIGSLPFLVGFGLYMISSEYIELLFTHKIGHIMLIASAVWMSLGILVMRQMINFKI